MKRTVKLVLLAFVLLGFLATGVAQQVITTTTTTVVTLPGSSYTTTIKIPGGNQTVTIQYPGYVHIWVEKHPSRVCTLIITPIQQPSVTTISIPATTIIYPATTIFESIEITVPTYSYATTYQAPGETITYTGVEAYEFVTSTEVPGVTTIAFTLPLPVYAEIVKSCDVIEVVVEEKIIPETVPATIVIGGAFGGATYTFSGYTMTLTFSLPSEFTETLEPTTKTTTENGTTYTTTTTVNGTTYVTTMYMNATTVTTVVTEPGSVVTSTITYTTTIPAETSGKTTSASSTPKTTSTKPPSFTYTYKTTTQTAYKPPFPLGMIIIAVSAVLVLAGAIILFVKRS